ncbi:MAG TPA: PilZ domain-containing protein [Myxococcales bacterium]|jgi:hypothetical protein
MAERLVAEVARCLNGGFSTLEVRRPPGVGSRFVFELSAWLLGDTVEIVAEVVSVDFVRFGCWRLGVRYDLARRGGLDEALHRVLGSKDTEPMRRAPRVPVQLPAVADDGSPVYLVRDLSLVGAGVDVEEVTLSPVLQVGAPVRLCLVLEDGRLLCPSGKVVWLRPSAAPGSPDRARPGFGVEFEAGLGGEGLDALDRILMLKSSPRCTWLSLGP